jgi:DNA repair protein RecO (recombination protein O)
MTESDKALLIRRIRWSETSLIVTWFSEAHGKVRTVAKGALRPKNRNAGLLDLFYLCEIQWHCRPGADLGELREVSLLETHEGIRNSYHALSLASYMAESVDHFTEANHPEPRLFDLLARALRHVATQGGSSRALIHFEKELAKELGVHHPDTDPHQSLWQLVDSPKLRESRRELARSLI